MPSPALFMNLLLDFVSRQQQVRVPEPEMVMDDDANTEAFMKAGREDGILAHTYLYHAIQASAVIAPGARVLDLGCGPANQLALIAQLNPDAHFIGVDASDSMLALARETLIRCKVSNVELRKASIDDLREWGDGSVDAVVSTITLHHLPDIATLDAVMRETARVLKPGGGLYIADFGRMKRQAGQAALANDRKAIQPEIFTQDFYNSVRAAFSLEEMTKASSVLGPTVSIKRTFLVPFLLVIRSAHDQPIPAACREAAKRIYATFSARQRRDFFDLTMAFKHGGFPLAFKPQ
ncbi:class I SAM-dependent methyltransferase [Uliginosibacterium sp. H3]|uniref:Class I SAM-dependent methyltransferase n=1 Tax=Uliginosibacterium silvisoli TaxID=3114758 RepID=A0ABU6KAY6_9RHOO|nr:class I SAM-dependent methyltransferase [Uliginosibacterium sp. H3]